MKNEIPKITLSKLKELYYDSEKYSFITGNILIKGQPELNNCVTVVNKDTGIDTLFLIKKENED